MNTSETSMRNPAEHNSYYMRRATAVVVTGALAVGGFFAAKGLMGGEEPSFSDKLSDMPTRTMTIQPGEGVTEAVETVNPGFEDRTGQELVEFQQVIDHVEGQDGVVQPGQVEIPKIDEQQAGAQ